MSRVRVSPDCNSQVNARKLPRNASWRRLEQRWNGLQVGRQGSYSVERLESLDHYCRTTSRSRVALVCILTPLPALMTAVLLECLPLRPPSEGWRANWMFWVRFGLMVFTLCIVGISELVTFLPDLHFTLYKRLFVSLTGTATLLGVCLLATICIGFPVPFVWQWGGFVLGSSVPVLVLLVFGRGAFAKKSPSRLHLERFVRFLFAYLALFVCYPLFKALYDLVPKSYRAYTTILLPVWRFIAERCIIRATRELEDFIPEIVAFSVDFLSALFVSVCISAAGPIYLSSLFICADIGQALLEFREVHTNACMVVKLLQQRRSSQLTDEKNYPHQLVTQILAVTRNPSAYRIASLKGVRLRSCLPHPLALEQIQRLRELETSGVYERKASTTNIQSCATATQNDATPLVGKYVAASAEGIIGAADAWMLSRKKATDIVVQGLQLLFHCEYLIQVEYVECAVPLVFAIFKSILHKLPNVVYYPGGVESWNASAALNVLVFAALEAGSLLLFNAFLRRKFAFSPLYQLAFVLETQMYVIQASLFLEVVSLMHYELAHLGVDFSFRFEWLRNKNDLDLL